MSFNDRGDIDRRSSRLDDWRRVDSGVNDGALGRAVGDFRAAARDSNLLGAVDSAGLLRDRDDRSGDLSWLSLGEADDRRVCRGQGRVGHVSRSLLVGARSDD